MLEKSFARLYNKFKLQLYARVLNDLSDKKEDALTPQEVICMEIILALRHPTVAEFANLANLSPPNAAYRVNRMVKKGYLEKTQSQKDKREFHLHVTKKYREDFGSIFNYMNVVCKRIENRFDPEEAEQLDNMLKIISDELMPEVDDSMRRVKAV